MANKPKLNRAQVEYALRCERIRVKTLRKVGRQAVADKLGIPYNTLGKYLTGYSIPLEDWEARRGPSPGTRRAIQQFSQRY